MGDQKRTVLDFRLITRRLRGFFDLIRSTSLPFSSLDDSSDGEKKQVKSNGIR